VILPTAVLEILGGDEGSTGVRGVVCFVIFPFSGFSNPFFFPKNITDATITANPTNTPIFSLWADRP
jgi:hypothetical protein